MIRKFYKVRTSESFCHLWKELSVSGIGWNPFFQEATDRVFQEMITAAFPLESMVAENSNPEPETLTYEDANVVRYIAGYVCRKIRKNIEVSSRPNKQQLISCVEGLLGGEGDTPSADWVDVVDRGGLLHIKEGTYMLFYAMEEEVREYFRLQKISQLVEGSREPIEECVLENKEVLFQWCMLTAGAEDDVGAVVLGMLVKLWITVRGFSFTSAWLEQFKQRKNTDLETLRKTLK